MSRTVYLAHGIDQGHDDAAMVITKTLVDAGYTVFDPATAWYLPPGEPNAADAAVVMSGNHEVMGNCEFLVAILDPNALTIGTIMEMEAYYNRRNAGHILVYGPRLEHSVALVARGWPVFSTTQALIETMVRLESRR